jgi:hypothetical protein
MSSDLRRAFRIIDIHIEGRLEYAHHKLVS